MTAHPPRYLGNNAPSSSTAKAAAMIGVSAPRRRGASSGAPPAPPNVHRSTPVLLEAHRLSSVRWAISLPATENRAPRRRSPLLGGDPR